MSSEDGSVSGAGSLMRVALADAKRSIALLTTEACAPVSVPDVSADDRYNPDIDIEAALDKRSCILSVPICDTHSNQVLGVVQVMATGRSGFDRK